MTCRTVLFLIAVFVPCSPLLGCSESSDAKTGGDAPSWSVQEHTEVDHSPPTSAPPTMPGPPQVEPAPEELPTSESFRGRWAISYGWHGRQIGDYYTFGDDGVLDVVHVEVDEWYFDDYPLLFKSCLSNPCPLTGEACSIGGWWEEVGAFANSRGVEGRVLRTGVMCDGQMVEGEVDTTWEKLPDQNVWKLDEAIFPNGARAVLDTARVPWFLMPCTDTNLPCSSDPF